jgi:glycosyltransferase involved in cell wall biosynthesis
MHRSGTSAVARLLSLLGLGLPQTPVGPRPSNELGHFGESERIRSLHDELLASAGSDWDDVLPFPAAWLSSFAADEYRARMVATLGHEYPESTQFVLKDPRICRLIPFWLGVLEEFGAQPAFVLPLRNPLEVAASLARRNEFSDSKSLLLWLRHVLDAERDTRGQSRVFVSYADVLRDPRSAAAAISEAIGLDSRGAETPAEPERFLPADQRHHDFSFDELTARKEVVEWVKEAYALLLAACDSDGPPDPDRLDELTAALADADLAYGPVLAESRREAEDLHTRLQSERGRLDAERERHVEATRKLQAEMTELQAELTSRDASLSMTTAQLKEREGELRSLQSEHASLEETVRELRASLEEAVRELRDRTLTRRVRRAWSRARAGLTRGRRSLGQLGSWMLNPTSVGRPRNVWELVVLRRSGAFDRAFYLRRNPDVAAAGMDPLMHYIEHGARAGLDPSPSFSTAAYLAEHPELTGSGVNPLYHFCRSTDRKQPVRHDGHRSAAPAATANQRARAAEAAQRPYAMFGDYLAYATVFPRIEPPLTEPDRRVLGAMDSRRRQLVTEYARRSEDRLVSVIMPTYNRLGVLEAAIDSVRAQRYAAWELIVVDDASTDGSAAYVEGLDDDRIRLVTLGRNRGVAAARNAGLEAARGELIAYLDSDNTWHPDYLLVMAGVLSDDPGADVAYCAQEIWRATPTDGRGGELEAVRFGPFNRALLENRNYIDINAVVHTEGIVNRKGGFDEALPRLVDWELLLRYTVDQGAVGIPCVLSRYEVGNATGQLTDTPDWSDVLEQLLGIVQTPQLDVRLPEVEDVAASVKPRPLHKPITRTSYERGIAIVIPSFEAEEYLRACVESAFAYTDGDFRVIIVDNGSGAAVQAYLDSLEAEGSVEVIRNGSNLGFSQAANRGIEAAGNERDIVLLNNDALVTPGWIRGMWDVFDHVDDVGLVVPRQTLFPGTPTTSVHVPYSRADREVDVSLSAHHANVLNPFLDSNRGYVELRFATFFCVYLPTGTLEAVGPLNVEHGPHYRSDRLYCDMVREFAKRRIVYTPHAKLYHFLQRSTRELQETEPSLYKDMFVRNDWRAVGAGKEGFRAKAQT